MPALLLLWNKLCFEDNSLYCFQESADKNDYSLLLAHCFCHSRSLIYSTDKSIFMCDKKQLFCCFTPPKYFFFISLNGKNNLTLSITVYLTHIQQQQKNNARKINIISSRYVIIKAERKRFLIDCAFIRFIKTIIDCLLIELVFFDYAAKRAKTR